jgi:hypothetical protein
MQQTGVPPPSGGSPTAAPSLPATFGQPAAVPAAATSTPPLLRSRATPGHGAKSDATIQKHSLISGRYELFLATTTEGAKSDAILVDLSIVSAD